MRKSNIDYLLTLPRFNYLSARTTAEACSFLAKYEGKSKVLGGGTDLLVAMKKRKKNPQYIIGIKQIPNLDYIKYDEKNGLRIGALATLNSVGNFGIVKEKYDILSEVCRTMATPQVRNIGTVAGNICQASPSADCAPPLMVMEASLILQGPKNKREVAIEDFFKGPGKTCMDTTEILTEIKIPPQREQYKMAFLKISRVAQDIAIVNAAVCLEMEKNRCKKCNLIIGAVAPVPLRVKSVEKMIEGNEISPELLDKIGKRVEEDVKPITDVRSTKEYRRITSGELAKRVIQKAINMPFE